MKSKTLVTFVVIEAIVIAGLLGYIIANHHSFVPSGNFIQRGNGTFQGNFQINQSAQNEVTSIFGNATSQSDVNSYCQTQRNMPSCFYYCRDINPQNQYCSSLFEGRQMFNGGAQ